MKLATKMFAYAAVLLPVLAFAGAAPVAAAHKDAHEVCCGRDGHCATRKDTKLGCCPYIACGEVGNRGFFTLTNCPQCRKSSGQPLSRGRGSCCCSSPNGMMTHKVRPVTPFEDSIIWPTEKGAITHN